ncbi:hypothetical protein ACW5WQ_13565 [Aeromonas rivuli]|jgi:hypothetical protein|uniref:hypothetical protein n=1 Tax=Aeromonas TaxID=642 RepID=UPI0012ED4E54|nr:MULTISPECIES: hypothetical protein [Aeromonas]MCS3460744.1 hypothetical protein [Aeromonas sp. BIGb0445]
MAAWVVGLGARILVQDTGVNRQASFSKVPLKTGKASDAARAMPVTMATGGEG